MRGAAKPDIRRSRRLARILAANPRAAIYGTIVATAVIAATAAGGMSPALILAATVATLLVFWLAHVYADFLDHGLRHGHSDLKVLGSIMVQELTWDADADKRGRRHCSQGWQAPGGHDRHAEPGDQ